jgi:uncharacterized delta-60 repeat protein
MHSVIRKSAFIFLLILVPFIIFSGPTPTPTTGPGFIFTNFATNGFVYSLTNSANTLYVGGSFSRIGLRTGSLFFSDSNGARVMSPMFPEVDGTVYCMAPDGTGGFFIGGTFSYVAGQYRNHLAHILSDGSLDPAWQPQANNTVRAMALGGTKVFIGGFFTSVAGTGGAMNVRNYCAALDSTSGALLGFNPNFNGYVYAVNYYSTIRVIIGGTFTTAAGGLAYPYLATFDPSVDPGTLVTALNYGINGPVYAIAREGLSYPTYIGGAFTYVSGTVPRNRMAYYPTFASTTPTAADFNLDNTVRDLSYSTSNGLIYATGDFQNVNGSTPRNYAAAFTPATGAVAAWKAELNASGNCISANGSSVYVGGSFNRTTSGGTVRGYAASFDLLGGTPTSWDPELDGPVFAINFTNVATPNILVGGSFNAARSAERNNLASVDIVLFTINPWNPNVDNSVLSLALANNTVYAGGIFTTANGSFARQDLASFDMLNGTVTSWNPGANGQAFSMIPIGTNLYMGGTFSIVAGTSRNYAAAVDLSTGALQAWNPNLNGFIRAMEYQGGIIYAGGNFTTTAGGANVRDYAAAFDTGTGVTQPWNPFLNNAVFALAQSPGKIYLGGQFTTVNGGASTRNYVAVFTTGGAGSLDPYTVNPDNVVYSLKLRNNALLLGGNFSYVNSILRPYMAAADATTGAVSAWNPYANNYEWCMLTYGSRVVFGGYMTDVSFLPHGYGGVIECPYEMYTPTFTVTPTYTVTQTSTFTYTRTASPTFTMTSTYSPTPVPVYMAPFQDNFSIDKNWAYDTEWQRKPAAASSGQTAGYPDPATDHTGLGDNFVAGTVIGGNMSTAANHPYYYLMSPYIDSSLLSKLELRFWRYLNTDYPGYIPCTVDVYNGTSWINIYTNPATIQDNAWNEQVYDVTAYKNSKFRVRFGHSVVNAAGAWIMSGWNVDDVYVGPPFTPTVTQSSTATPTFTTTPTYTLTPTPCTILDPAFNGSGTVIFNRGNNDIARDMTVDGLGRLILAGNSDATGGNYMSAAWRYNANGSVDATFGSGGYSLYDAAPGTTPEICMGVAVDPSNRVLIAGYKPNGTVNDAYLARFNDAGLDASFGAGGSLTRVNSYFSHVIVDGNGKIVACGSVYTGTNADAAVFRYNTDGTPDLTFNGTGYCVLASGAGDDYANGLAMNPAGNIVVVGESDSFSGSLDCMVWKVLPSGVPDLSFNGGTGYYRWDGPNGGDDSLKNVIIDHAGRIVAVGSSYDGAGPATQLDGYIVRLNPDGTLDTTFSAPKGYITIDMGNSNEYVSQIAEDTNHRLVLAGVCDRAGNNDFALWRGTEAGLPDLTFGSGNAYMSWNGPSNLDDGAMGLVIDSSNRIIAAGYATNAANQDMAIIALKDNCSVFNTRTPTPSWTASPTASPTGTYTVTVTGTPTRTCTPTGTSTMTFTYTASPTCTRTATQTSTSTITQTFTVTQSATTIILSATITPTYSISPTFTITPTYTVSPTSTKTVTQTSTPTFTGTPTYTITATPTFTSTGTDTDTPTATQTGTPTGTYTTTASPTCTVTPTYTDSGTPTMLPSVTNTARPSETFTATYTISPTGTGTVTVTITPTYTVTEISTDTFTVTETSSQTPTATILITMTATITQTSCPLGVLGNNNSTGTSQMSSGGTLYASRFDLVQNATILQIHVYVSSGAGNAIMAGIYTDSGGKPGTLLVPTLPQICTNGWNTINISAAPMIAGVYWLAVEAQYGVNMVYAPGNSGDTYSIGNTFGTCPDPFGSSPNPLSEVRAIYADFCPDLGYLVTATVTPTAQPTGTITPTATIAPAGLPAPDAGDSYVYPLPASVQANFAFNLSEQADVTISIFDFAGNFVCKKLFTNQPAAPIGALPDSVAVDVSHFSTGIYFYIIKAKGVSGNDIKYNVNKFIVRK